MEPLNEVQKQLRRKLIEIAYKKKVGHIGSALSCLDLIYVIYRDNDMTKTKFVLSKGHAVLAYYVVLNHFGYISDELLETYCDDGSELYGHVSLNPKIGTECTTGSLGHGVCIATGLALGDPHQNIICLTGDGEMQEGSYWESIVFLRDRKMRNLFLITDGNGYQGYDETLTLPTTRTIWHFLHDDNYNVLGENLNSGGLQRYWYFKTVKGHGISFLEEGGLASHYLKLTEELYEQAMKELE